MTVMQDRARLDYIEHRLASPMVTYAENVREDVPELIRMAEDGFKDRETLALVEALVKQFHDESHRWDMENNAAFAYVINSLDAVLAKNSSEVPS